MIVKRIVQLTQVTGMYAFFRNRREIRRERKHAQLDGGGIVYNILLHPTFVDSYSSNEVRKRNPESPT